MPFVLWYSFQRAGIYFMSCLGTVLLLGMSNKSVAVGCLVLLVFSSWAYMASLGKINPYGGQRMFNAASQHRESVLYALAVLALTLCVRLFRQTADAWTMAFLPVALALVLWLARRQRIAPYRGHSLRTLWYGAVTNFLYVFSLFYLTSIGEARTLDVVYFAIGAGAAVPTLVGPWVKQWVGSARYEELCILCAAISSAVLMVPSLYVVGTAFVSMFVTMGSQESFEVYLADNRFPAEERRLVRAKFYGIGCVYEQTMMLVAIFACSALAGGGATSAMAGYALRESAATNAQAYHWALLVCLVANAVAGFLLMRSTGDEVASQSAVRSL